MTNNEIVAKLWNLCNVLRDDGITYQDYVTELTYILFLKMAKETGAEKNIPEEYRWDKLSSKDGIELKRFYATLLQELGEHGKGKIQHIYSGASSKIDEPANLKKIITSIDDLDWYSAKEEGLGNLYEGLLEKNANEKKSGAGQYFTPRALIDVMTELIAPQPGEKCNDPACGTYGFMIAADRFVKNHTNDLFDLSEDAQHFQKYEAFTGAELVHETHRLALMNSMLHDIEGEIYLCDTLSNQGRGYILWTGRRCKNSFEEVTVADAVLETESDNRNLLEQKIKELCRVKRQAVIQKDSENAGKYKIVVEFGGIESDSAITVSPFNSKQEQLLAEHIEFSELEILQLSEFYEITVRSGDDTIRRIIMIPTSGFPDDRESAAVNSVVKDRASFVEYIAFVLGDDYVASMLEGKQMGESGFFANSSDAMPALYEKMLKTSVEEPERIKDIGYVLRMVTDKDIIPDEFRKLYETFCNTLKIRR